MGFAMRAQQPVEVTPAAVGIDLGTCLCRVAMWQEGDVLIIPNERGHLATPSCVAFTEHSILVGEAAQDQADGNMENTIVGPQRLIGFKLENPWVQWYMRMWPSKVVLGDDDEPMIRVRDRGKERRLRPEEIVTMLLVHLRKMAEKFLASTVMDVVITVPAQYGPTQRKAILSAAQGARLNVLELVKSPTCAAIAYSLTNRTRIPRTVLVCDMGASYFDFALIVIEDGRLTERAIGTDYVDLDSSVVRFCIQDLKDKYSVNVSGQRESLERLRRGCELAKRKLSQYNQARVEVASIVDGVDYVCNMSRMHFDELCKDDLGALLDPISWCLEDSGVEKADVHEVVLVGGCARIPSVRRAIREFFYGKVPREVLRPDHAAVLGAAAYVAFLAGNSAPELRNIQLQQVTPWSTAPAATAPREDTLKDTALREFSCEGPPPPAGSRGVSQGGYGPGVARACPPRQPNEYEEPSMPDEGLVNSANMTQGTKGLKEVSATNSARSSDEAPRSAPGSPGL